jgi:hypothetical protein
MRNFYEMMQILEDEQDQAAPDQESQQQDTGLGDEAGGQAPPDAPQTPNNGAPQETEEPKHYMFFSGLKAIKEKVEAMLAMDPAKVDAMLDDGHDWASDHISTSRDDVEEVYDWLAGEMGDEGGEATPEAPGPVPQGQG